MPQVIYLGNDEVITAANGGAEPVNHGDVLEVDDDTAGGLVGYGHGDWRYLDAKGNQLPPIDTTPAPEPTPDTTSPVTPDGENEENV